MVRTVNVEGMEQELTLSCVPPEDDSDRLQHTGTSAVVLTNENGGMVKRNCRGLDCTEVLDVNRAEKHCSLSIAVADVQRPGDDDGLTVQRHRLQVRHGILEPYEFELRRIQCHHHTVHALLQRMDGAGAE